MAAMIMIPNHMPALNIPPTTSQDVRETLSNTTNANNSFFFMRSICRTLAKALP